MEDFFFCKARDVSLFNNYYLLMYRYSNFEIEMLPTAIKIVKALFYFIIIINIMSHTIYLFY